MKTTYNFTKENNDQMLYKLECFENIFNRIYSIKKNSQTVIYLSTVVLISSKQHG